MILIEIRLNDTLYIKNQTASTQQNLNVKYETTEKMYGSTGIGQTIRVLTTLFTTTENKKTDPCYLNRGQLLCHN